MSAIGIQQFNDNLLHLMDSKAFKEAREGKKLELGFKLLKSKYGLGKWYGFGSIEKFKQRNIPEPRQK